MARNQHPNIFNIISSLSFPWLKTILVAFKHLTMSLIWFLCKTMRSMLYTERQLPLKQRLHRIRLYFSFHLKNNNPSSRSILQLINPLCWLLNERQKIVKLKITRNILTHENDEKQTSLTITRIIIYPHRTLIQTICHISMVYHNWTKNYENTSSQQIRY